MKRIMITGSGGSPSTNFIRSLRASPENFFIAGTDCDKYYLLRSETDEKFLVPKASDKHYLDVLNQIISEKKIDFLHVQNDVEMGYISELRNKLDANTFLPSKKTIKICLDKFESYKYWAKAGVIQPETMRIRDEIDLKNAFEKYGSEIWLRDTTGAGGRGSLRAPNFKVAKSWLDFHSGWNKFTAAECLKEQSITFQSIWKDGELVVAQGRKRLYWELSKLAPSGISGATGTGMTFSDDKLSKIAQDAVFAIDKNPNGIFSVDLTYDNKGIPNPTEINIGRFFTTHEFFTRAGLNMPYIFIKLAYKEKIPEIKKKICPLKDGLVWIRGMDFLPVFSDLNTINNNVNLLSQRIKELEKGHNKNDD